ncbi:NupC/NupG family nucleoside CNT transporter [bacterium]|nr:NupC/NupG family nucleoside CNT transporter [bacterium]
MDIFTGLIGIVIFLLIAYCMSNNKRHINYKTVIVGLLLQIFLAVFILKIPIGVKIFGFIASLINQILSSSMDGATFVFGWLCGCPDTVKELFPSHNFIYAIMLIATMIFIMSLVNILYYYGIMQRIILFLGRIMNKLMDVSGAEALSNCASPFVGNVAAQSVIKPYLPNLTRSELLSSMTGSTACLSGGALAMYAGFGVPVEYLLAASVMAAPGAFVISKIVYPEMDIPKTKDDFKISRRKTDANVLAAIAKGAADGMKVSLNVIAMLLALVALISFGNFILGKFGLFLANSLQWDWSKIGIDLTNLSIEMLVGKLFAVFAAVMGATWGNIEQVGTLIGQKFIINETVSYLDMKVMMDISVLTPKSIAIATCALAGFANLSTVAIQIGGIGELAPNQRKNLARLGVKALICGTLTSYVSACIAGIVVSL